MGYLTSNSSVNIVTGCGLGDLKVPYLSLLLRSRLGAFSLLIKS